MSGSRALSISFCPPGLNYSSRSRRGGADPAMMRTIKQRIYWLGLLPLALLSVALIAFNGAARIDEAQGELRNAQKLTAELLRNPAIEALVVGNDLAFEQTTKELLNASSSVSCI